MDFLEKKKWVDFFLHSSLNFETSGKNPFFFLSELQEEAKINISEDVEYIPEYQGI